MKYLKRIWKKGVALLLAATMSLSLLPVTALAAGNTLNVSVGNDFSYDPTTGKVHGTVNFPSTSSPAPVGTAIVITIVSSTQVDGVSDMDATIGSAPSGFTPSSPGWTDGSLPIAQMQTTINDARSVTFDGTLKMPSGEVGTLEYFKSQNTNSSSPYYNVAGGKFTYSVYVYDNQTNYGSSAAFTISLSAKAELKADPSAIYLPLNAGTNNLETVDIDLTNIVSGTTAQSIALTNSNAALFQNFNYISVPSSIAGDETKTISVPVKTGTAGGAIITIAYDDATAGAQTPITVEITVGGAETLSADAITLTGTGAAGKSSTDVKYTPTGTGNTDTNIAMVKSITVSDGFTLDTTVLEQAGGLKKTFPMQTVASTLRTQNKKTTTMTFSDYLVVTNTDPSLLVEDTIIGYVTIVYYNCAMGGATSVVKTDGSEVPFQRVLKVPIYYSSGSTPTEPVITFDAGGGTLTGNATPTVTGGKVAVGDIPTASRTGYKFLGWSGGTLTNATAAQVAAVTHSADTTYTAQWEQQYRVTYNSNLPTGASVSNMPTSPSAYLDKGSNYTLVGTPSCSGATDGRAYKFKGWGATANATTTITSINNISKDETVYAIWEKLPQVTFKIGTGGKFSDNTTADKTLNANASGIVTAPGVTANTGYSFKGWNDGTSTLTEAQVNAKNHTADTTTYTAQWELRKVVGGAASGSTVKGGSMSLDSVTLNDTPATTILKANYGASDLATIEWYLAGSKGDGDTVPNGETAMTGGTGADVTIPTSAIEGQTIWVKIKGKGNNIATDVYWLYVGEVGKESYKFQVGVKVDGQVKTGAAIPTGIATTPAGVQTVKGGSSFNVTASSSNVGYTFDGWDIGDATGGAFTAVNTDGSVSSFKAPETGLNTSNTYTIYAKFKSVPHLTLADAGGATGSQAFNGTVTNDGAATAYKVKYELDGGDANDFSLSKANPTNSQLAAAGTDSLTVTCNGTTDGKTYTTTLKITYSDSATGSVVGTITQPISFTYIEPRKTVYVNIKVDTGMAQPAVAGITVTPDVDHKVTLKKEETTLVSTNTAASSGYRFKGWSSNLGDSSATVTNTGGTGTFKMPDPAVDTVITANYISVPYLTLAATTAGEHYYGVNTVTNATATVTNKGKANATAVKVSVGDNRFTLAGGMNATGNTVNANNGTGTIQIAPADAASLAVGVYTIPVTVTYKQESTDADITVTTNVTYEVKEKSYTLTVVENPAAGVTKVEYKKNSDNMATYTAPITVKSSDTVTLIATMANGYTGTWTVGSTCTANINSGTVLGLSGFTGNATATLSVTGKAKLTYEPTAGAATEGAATVTTNPALKISNTGTGDANITKITVENNNSSDSKTFGGSTSTAANLAAGADRSITLAPNNWGASWTAGTYTAKVTVEYTDSAGSHTDVTYVPFTVSAPSTFTGKVTVKWNNTDTLGSNVTGVSLTGNLTGTQSGNTWTFANLSSASAYAITVATANGNVTSTQTLNNGNQEVIIYLSTVTVQRASGSPNGSTVQLNGGSAGAGPITGTYEKGTAVAIAAAAGTQATADGYSFDKWNDGSNNFYNASYTVVAGETNTTYTASFVQGWKLTYNGNKPSDAPSTSTVTNVPTDPKTYNANDNKAQVSTVQASLPGYAFQGWFEATTGGTAVTGELTLTGSKTLYAHWLKAGVTGQGDTVLSDSTTYGANFSSGKVAAAARGNNPGVPLEYTSSDLTAIGLSIDKTTGLISGQPYKVADNQSINVTVKRTDNNETATYTYTLTVGKAQPTLTASVASGNQTGSAFSAAKYNYTVTAPLYTGSTNGWQNATIMVGTGVTLADAPTSGAYANAGGADFDATTPGNTLFTSNSNSIKLTYAPGSKTDGASNAYTAIYENAATTLSVAGTGVVEALSISPNTYDFGDVYDDGSQITQTNYTQPGAYTYRVKNEGNVTTGAITITAPTGYTITTALSKTTLAPGETATFSIQPDAHLAVGTHPGVISASYTSAQTGTPTISASAGADFEVKAPSTFSGYITVKTQAVGASSPSVALLPGDYSVKLVSTDGNSTVTGLTPETTTSTDPKYGRYRFTGADATKEYTIVVTKTGVNAGSWTVPDRLVSLANRTNQGLILYELATDDDGTSGVTTTGDGYYLAGVGVTITATASVGNMAFDKWTEVTAQSSPNPTSYSNNAASTSYAMPAQSATLTAHYKNTDATECTITYDANRPSNVKNDVNIWTPGPETGVAVGTAHTLLTGTPTLLGYTFEGWFAAPTGGTAITSVTPAGDTTVYAHWTPVALAATGTAPDGTYGTGYTGGKVSVTAPTGATATYKVTSGTLPGGLTLDENTGAITGIPYEICTNRPVTVTVTMSNDVNTTPRTATVDLTITIKPATPTITGVTATNVVTDADPDTYNYVVTVAGPKYNGTGWETAVDELVYTPGTTAGKQSGIGSAAFTDASGKVKVDFTPANTDFDGANQKQNAVWTTATKTVSVSPDSNKVALSVTPTEWEYKKADGSHAQEGFTATTGTNGMVTAANAVAPKQFTLKNEGNVPSGTLSYKFASANAAGQPGDYFTFAWGTATAAGLGANASGTFTVSVRDTEITQAGTYTDTLTISNAAGDSATVYRLVFVVDKSATYTATVTVKVKNVGGSLTAGKMPTTGFTAITLVPSDTSTGATTVTLSDTYWDNTNTNYKVTGLVTGVTYTVKTGDFVLGAVAVNGDNVDVELYQVQLDKTPSTITVTQTGAGYYAKGQGASIATPASATGGYAFQEWADDATTPNKIATASFNAVIQDAVKYTATYTAALTLTYDLNGGTAGTTPNPDTESHQAKDLVTLASCDATKIGYSFGGWNTKQDGSGVTYQPGATFSMPAENTTLYAVWIENDTPVVAPSGSWTVAHRDTLSQTLTAGGGVGGYTYTVTGSGLPGTTNVTVTGGSTLTIASGTNGAEYTKDGTNTGSVSVGVTDKSGAAANPAGTVTVIVVQAATSVTTGVDAGYKPYEGDDFDFTELENPEVIVKKTDGTPNTSVDINEMPTAADGTAPEGTWKVVGTNPTTKDGNPAIEYVLEFTPSDPGFLPSQTTVTVPIQTRKIKAAEIGIFFPANGGTPNTVVSGDNGKKIAATTTPNLSTDAEKLATFKVDNISWAPADKFDSKNDSTVYVQLTAEDGWEFSDTFAGTLSDQTASSTEADKTATVIGNTGKTLTLMYVFKGEDQVVDDIYVETTAELKVDGTDSKLIGKPADALKYTVTDYHWEKTTGHEAVDNGHPFLADTLYDAVVKVEANEGYKFNTANFGTDVGNDIKDHAKIDNGVPKENPKTNTVEEVMSADGKSITIRFSAFKPVALKVVGIRVTEGALTTTDYYAVTDTDKSGNDVNKATAYGHGSWGAIYSDAGKASIKYVLVYEDGSESTPISYTNETLVYGASASGTLPAMPANGYTFTNEGTNDDQAKYDGKNVYLSYTVGSNTYYAAQPVGTLTVQELKADKLTPSRVWTTAELTFVKGTAFKLPTTNAPTATVDFNTGSLPHSETGWAYNATATNGSNTHYYMIDATGDDGVPETQITAATTMSDTTHNGKTLYMCYTDINGNLVYAPVGVLKVSGDTNIKVWISNTSDPTDNGADISGAKPGATTGGATEPEYGETIKANVEGTPDGNLTYTWKDATTGDVLQTGPSDTYVLGKDDVDKTITVIVTESGTSGATETVNKPVGQKRTLKLDVIHVSKVYDGTVTNTHTYKTTSATSNDFILTGVINNDGVYVSAYETTAVPAYEAAAVGSTFDWPAISDATRGNYTLSDGDHYRLGDQLALPDRGEIVGDDTINPITVKNDDIQPVRGGKPTDTPFTKPDGESRYDVDTTKNNSGKGTWYWNDNGVWKPVAEGGLDNEGNFKPSTTYKVVVETKAEDGKKFAENADGYYDIGGRLWPADVTVGADQTTATLTVEFPPTAAPEGDINVTYVTAFFQNPPIVDETIPAHPDWVGREVETVSTTVNDSKPEHFVVRWYESDDKATWGAPLAAGYTFKPGKYYKVEVDVKPGNGYAYNLDSTDKIMDTKFAINTSAGTNDATAVKNGDAYTMSYVFPNAVVPIEIAHVNLSVPQPVVEGEPADHSTVTVNQALGTNGTDYKATLNVTNVTWSTADAFEADTEYTLEFDVATGTYDYLNETNKVDFIVGGVGPIEGAGSATGTGAVKSVETTATDADNLYHVKVTFNGLKGGKVTLTDVYVNATVPATDKNIDTGYKPFVDAVKPYELTGTGDVWQYWDGSWKTITDGNAATALDSGKFKAGVPYQVIGIVRMKTDADSAKYVIDDAKTKFYLAGIECTTTAENVVAGTGTYTPLVKNAGDPDTYTLTRQFLIPVDKIITEVTSHASAPAVGGTLTSNPYTDAVVDLAINGSGNILTSRVAAGTVTWKVQDGSNWVNVPGNTVEQGKVYQATYTLTTDTANDYTYKDDAANNNDRVKFTIHGVEITGVGTESKDGYTVTTARNSDSSYTITVTYPETSSDTKIAQVTVDYTVPVAGANPAVDKQYTQHEQVDLKHDALVTDDSHGSTWHEGDKNGAAIDASATFGNGDYTVVATFNAKEGYVFDNNTAVIVNGNSYTVASGHVTLSNNNKTATVWHTFPGLDKEIVKVITAVTAPVAGAVPQAKADTTLAANKGNTNLLPDALAADGKATITWKTAAGGNVGATFDYSTAYTAEFDVTVASGYTYLNGTPDKVEWIVNSIVADATGKGIIGTGSLTKDHVTVTTSTTSATTTYHVKVEFPATKDNVQNVLEVHVDTILPPRYKNPIPAAAVRAPQPYEDVGTTTKWQKWADPDGDGTSEWVDVAANETFANGVKYRVTSQVHLKQDAATKRDYDITTATKFFIGDVEIPQAATTATKPTGKNYTYQFAASDTAADGKYGDATTYTLTLEFDALVENKVIVDFGGNVLTPVTGGVATSNDYKNVSKLFAHNKDGDDVLAHVKVGDATWKSSTDNVNFGAMPADNTFVKDTYYQATFDVEADTGYSFASDIDFLINGAMITGAGNATAPVKVDITGSGNKYTVTVTFPQTKDKADVLTVWGLAAPEVGKTISSQTPTVPESEPYKAVAAGTKWEHWDGSNWEPAAGTFLPGHRYKATIKTELKTDGPTAGKYQFTTSTAGYINDTEAGETTVTYLDASNNVIAAGADATPVYVQLEREFTMPKKTVEVHVKSDIPALSGTVATAQSSVGVDLVNYPDDANYYELTDTVTAGWYKDPEGTTAITDTEFAVGTYYLVVTVKPKEGYQLSESSGNYYWTTNNNQSSSIKPVVVNADSGEYRVAFLLKINEPGTTTTLQVKVPIPSKGDTTASKPGTSPDGSVNVDTTKWVSGTNTDGTDVGNFGEGQYTAVVYVKDVTPGETIYVNGNEETVKADADGKTYVTYTYSIPVTPPAPPPVIHDSGSSGGTTELPQVFYKLGEVGVTDDLTAEKVRMNGKPSKVPKVEGIQIEDSDGTKKTYTFIGWSETDPAKTTGTPVLVDPTTFKISKDKTFYAVYEIKGHTAIDHTHYVIGFPNGTFGPSADITRGEVATIIARACLDGFIEGANYGNPGGYSDVERHWAYSAISYCTINNVFTGYTDGTFRPNQPITRQELATVVARLAGLIGNQGVPFTDADQISKWARDGVYTAYAKGWIKGYKDGTFKPLQNITRAETVKVFNGYLGRGVDVKGLEEMREYVHSGVASNNQENGYDQYMTWPDVPKNHWAYYEIIEAANDHTFYWLDETNPVPPEHWSSVWIDEVWRYHDNSSDGARPENPETTTPGY